MFESRQFSRPARLATGMMLAATSIAGCSLVDQDPGVNLILTVPESIPQPPALTESSMARWCVDATFDECVEDDSKLIATIESEPRQITPYSELPPYYVKALVSSEDANISTHTSVDTKAILRAGLRNFRERGDVEGGSTLVQTLQEHIRGDAGGEPYSSSYLGKWNEIRTAYAYELQLAQTCAVEHPAPDPMGKISYFDIYKEAKPETWSEEAAEKAFNDIMQCVDQQVITQLANRVPQGREANDIATAAQKFFGKDRKLDDLKPWHQIWLAVSFQAPSNTDITPEDPLLAGNEEIMGFNRYAYVVDKMYNEGEITKGEAQLFKEKFDDGGEDDDSIKDWLIDYEPSSIIRDTSYAADICAEYVAIDAIHETTDRLGKTEKELAQDGAIILTTIDEKLQRSGCETIRAFNDNDLGYEGIYTAIALNGDIKTQIGGTEFEKSQVNLADKDSGSGGFRAGSIGKIEIYAKAVSGGLRADDIIQAPAVVEFPGVQYDNGLPFTVDNFSHCSDLGLGPAPCEGKAYDFFMKSSNTAAAHQMKKFGEFPDYGARALVEVNHSLGGDAEEIFGPSYAYGNDRRSTEGQSTVIMNIFRRASGMNIILKPTILEAVIAADGTVMFDDNAEETTDPAIDLSQDDALNFIELFKAPVEGAGGTAAGIFPQPAGVVAGKTGTAPKITPENSGKDASEINPGETSAASFAGAISFAEYDVLSFMFTGGYRDELNNLPFTSRNAAELSSQILEGAGIGDDGTRLPTKD